MAYVLAIPAARYACCAGALVVGIAAGGAGVTAVEAASVWRFGAFRELDRVPPACSYNGESGPEWLRMPLRNRVTFAQSPS